MSGWVNEELKNWVYKVQKLNHRLSWLKDYTDKNLKTLPQSHTKYIQRFTKKLKIKCKCKKKRKIVLYKYVNKLIKIAE